MRQADTESAQCSVCKAWYPAWKCRGYSKCETCKWNQVDFYQVIRLEELEKRVKYLT